MKLLCNVIQEGGQVCFTLPCLFDRQSFKVEAVAKSPHRVLMFRFVIHNPSTSGAQNGCLGNGV